MSGRTQYIVCIFLVAFRRKFYFITFWWAYWNQYSSESSSSMFTNGNVMSKNVLRLFKERFKKKRHRLLVWLYDRFVRCVKMFIPNVCITMSVYMSTRDKCLWDFHKIPPRASYYLPKAWIMQTKLWNQILSKHNIMEQLYKYKHT